VYQSWSLLGRNLMRWWKKDGMMLSLILIVWNLIKQINHGGPVGWGILAAAWHLATQAEKTPLESSRNGI